MEILFGIVGCITGIAGTIFGIISLTNSRIEAVNEYLKNDRDPAFIDVRKIVYSLPDNYDPKKVDEEIGAKIALLIISYQQAAILVKHKQLPFWLFKNNVSGHALTELFDKLKPFIEYRREKNPCYAKEYEGLCDRIKKEIHNKAY